MKFSLVKRAKNTGLKISKRKSTNFVLPFDDVLNDINDWLAKKNGKNNGIGDDLDELCAEEEEEVDSNPSEKCLEEEQESQETENNVDWQQRYGPRKQLTRNRNFHDIDSSLDKNNYKEMGHMNKDRALKELCGCLGPIKCKNTKKL